MSAAFTGIADPDCLCTPHNVCLYCQIVKKKRTSWADAVRSENKEAGNGEAEVGPKHDDTVHVETPEPGSAEDRAQDGIHQGLALVRDCVGPGRNAASDRDNGGEHVPVASPRAVTMKRGGLRAKLVEIPEEVKAVLRRAVIDGKTLRIVEQLDRKLYEATNKVLLAAGGKWNRSAKAHLFAADPREVLELAVEAGEILDEKKTFNIFETPPEIAARMVELAKIESTHRVLEPSAGSGNLLRAIGDKPDKVAVELNDAQLNRLRCCGVLWTEIHHGDFLECDPLPLDPKRGHLGTFDRVVMNPPFGNGADIRHIWHASTFLQDGGRLVALCANGPRQREEFRDIAVHWEEFPAGTFKTEGTNVSVAMFVLLKEDL